MLACGVSTYKHIHEHVWVYVRVSVFVIAPTREFLLRTGWTIKCVRARVVFPYVCTHTTLTPLSLG